MVSAVLFLQVLPYVECATCWQYGAQYSNMSSLNVKQKTPKTNVTLELFCEDFCLEDSRLDVHHHSNSLYSLATR